jgi:heme exporter protein C
VLNATAGDMPGEMRLTFLVALAGMALLYLTLVKVELTSKSTRFQLKRLRRMLEDEEVTGGATSAPLATVPARPTR